MMATRAEVISGITRVDRETIKSLIDSSITVIETYLRRQIYIVDFMSKRNIRLEKLINSIDVDRQSSKIEMQFNNFTSITSNFLGDDEGIDKVIDYINLLLYPTVKKYYYYNREYRELDKNINNIDAYNSTFTTIRSLLMDFRAELK